MSQLTIKEEFKKKYSIKVTPNNFEDEAKSIVLEKLWNNGTLDEMADWWLAEIIKIAEDFDREARFNGEEPSLSDLIAKLRDK